jgi:hypothetical protein
LDGQLDAQQDEDVIQIEIEEFNNNIKVVGAAIERHMEQNVALLCQILGMFLFSVLWKNTTMHANHLYTYIQIRRER